MGFEKEEVATEILFALLGWFLSLSFSFSLSLSLSISLSNSLNFGMYSTSSLPPAPPLSLLINLLLVIALDKKG